MYKLCERCHFHVPAKNALCNVCGSKFFSDISTEAGHTNIDQKIAAIAASSKTVSADVQVQLGAWSTRIGSAVADYGRDLLECGVKFKSAAIKMKNLLAMPVAAATEFPSASVSHDDLLSFHKNITFGRRAKAAQSTQTLLELPSNSFRDMHEPMNDMQPFTPMIVKPLDPDEFENALKADVETLKHNLDELKEWFENYGKADTLLRAQATQLQFSDRERHAA
jgi:hypothetical protein